MVSSSRTVAHSLGRHSMQSDLLVFVHNALSFLRREYSTDFAALFGDSIVKESYRDGLVFISCVIGSAFFLWSIFLIALKCNGHFVGCASGANFRPEYFKDPDGIPTGYTESQNTDTSRDHDLALEDTSLHSSLPSDSADLAFGSISEESIEKGSVASSVIHLPSKRERRTQIAFLVFAFLTLICVPLAHVLFFLPLREASIQSSDHIVEARDIVKEVQVSIDTVSLGLANSLDIFKNLPKSEIEVCPLGDLDAIAELLGFHFSAMINVYRDDYLDVEETVTRNTEEMYNFVEYFDDALIITERVTNQAEVYLWLVPGILLSTLCVTVAVSFGTIFSWRRESSQRMQLLLSYLALPILMSVSLTCWVLAITSAVGSAVAADACLAGASNGSPALTIQKMLLAEGVDETSFLAQMIGAYSTSCSGSGPTDIIFTHGEETTAIIKTIWQYMIAVDSIGRDELNDMCGVGNDVNMFLQSFRDLAQHLTTVSRALESVSISLSCPRINDLYDQAVNKSLCRQSADSLANGFLFFLAIGVTTMVLVTLRASWGQVIVEDSIYEEHEVAENMMVDEHEEYLLFISKYKHEWEEYDGLNSHSQTPISPPFGSMDFQSTLSPTAQSESANSSDDSPFMTSDHVPFLAAHDALDSELFDPYQSESPSISSMNSGEISFPSLTESPTHDKWNELSLLESRNPDDEIIRIANNDGERNEEIASSTHSSDEERGIVSSTGKSIELRLPPARYSSPRRSRSVVDKPERDVYIESTPGLVKFVLEVEDASPSFVQERVDQLSKPQKGRPLTPTRVRNQKMKDLASFYDSPVSDAGFYGS